MEASETSILSSYTDCSCYLCQYGINCEDVQVEPYPLYAAARQPFVYYAQTPCCDKKSCRKRPNCFVRAFRWYTNDHNAPKRKKKSDLSCCGAGQALDTCPQNSPLASDLGAFATWLDTKYEQFLQENAGCIKLTQTSVYETYQPLNSSPCEPTSTRKKYPKTANQLRVRRECNKRECKRDNSEQEINTISLEFIMTPKNLSRAASECCQPVSTPNFPVEAATVSKSQSDTVCLNKSGGDYRRGGTRTKLKTDKPHVEQKKKDLRVKKEQDVKVSCHCQKAVKQASVKTQYEPLSSGANSMLPAIKMSKQQQTQLQTASQMSSTTSQKPAVSIQCEPSNLTEPNKDADSNKDAEPNKDAESNKDARSNKGVRIQNVKPCPSLKIPCPNASANALEPCPSLKEPCPAARKCPSLRKPCPSSQPSASGNVLNPCPSLKEPCPAARKCPSLRKPCPSPQPSASGNVLNPCPSLKEPCPEARKCPSLRQPCPSSQPSASGHVLKPCPSLKETCPAALKCPSLRQPCPSSHPSASGHVLNPCSSLKQPYPETPKCPSLHQPSPSSHPSASGHPCPSLPEARKCPSLREPCVTICSKSSGNVPKPSLSLKEPCSEALKCCTFREPAPAPICPIACKNFVKSSPNQMDPCPKALKCSCEPCTPMRLTESSPTYPKEDNTIQLNDTTPPKQEEITLKPFAVNATPTVREANTETGEISVPCRMPYPNVSCPGSCRACCSIVQSITNTCPSFESHCLNCHGRALILRMIEPSQAHLFTAIRTSNTVPLEGICSVNCPFYVNKEQVQTVVKSQATATETQTVSFKADNNVQTSDCALRLDRSTDFHYPFFMRVVCADKL